MFDDLNWKKSSFGVKHSMMLVDLSGMAHHLLFFDVKAEHHTLLKSGTKVIGVLGHWHLIRTFGNDYLSYRFLAKLQNKLSQLKF